MASGYDNFATKKSVTAGIHESSTVADEENQPDDTYDYYIDMNGFRKIGLQLQLTGTITVKIYGTIQDDGTAAAACTYQDISATLFGAASITSSSIMIDDAEFTGCFHFLHVEIVCAGGGTDDYAIYAQRLY